MEMEIENTKTYLRNVTVKNTNAVAYEISFEAFDVEIDPDTHNVKMLPTVSRGNTLRSLASWIIPSSEPTFVLQPGEEKIFEYRFSAPVDAQPGDYYGSLNFYYKPVGVEQNGNITVRQSLGSLLLVSLAGPTPISGIEPYTLSKLSLNRMSDKTEVALDVQNNTLRFIHVRPLITLKDVKGDIFFQKEGVSKRVFPGEKSSVVHFFPNVYLSTEEDLTLYYSLWDRQKKEKLYEEVVPLGPLRGASASFDSFEWLLLWGGGAILLVLAAACWYKHRHASLPHLAAKPKRKPTARKKTR